MNNLFKPASFLMYFLVIIVFFVTGMAVAGLSGAAEGQDLAGGAIIFFYGMLSAAIAFTIALFYAYKSGIDKIRMINKILGVLFFLAACFITYRIITSDKTEVPTTEYPAKTKSVTQDQPSN